MKKLRAAIRQPLFFALSAAASAAVAVTAAAGCALATTAAPVTVATAAE